MIIVPCICTMTILIMIALARRMTESNVGPFLCCCSSSLRFKLFDTESIYTAKVF